jgi:hypothetical protein
MAPISHTTDDPTAREKGSPETKGEEKEIGTYYWKVVRLMLSTTALTGFLADNSDDV